MDLRVPGPHGQRGQPDRLNSRQSGAICDANRPFPPAFNASCDLVLESRDDRDSGTGEIPHGRKRQDSLFQSDRVPDQFSRLQFP